MENKKLIKRLNIAAYLITAAVLTLVGMMRRVKIDVSFDTSFLPGVNAGINIITSVLLLLALWFIKQKNIEAHKKTIYVAICTSALFLLTYVLYHFTNVETSFCKEGTIRSIYYFVLATHVILAGVIFPFILFTFIRAYTGQIDRHRAMAKWVWPVWFYVSVTGPIVYFMLKPCYN